MNPSNFCFSDWEYDRMEGDLPKPPNKYKPMNLSGGKNGRGINVSRALKSHATRNHNRFLANQEFFLKEVLPLIENKLNSQAWFGLANDFQTKRGEFMQRGGWYEYRLGEKRGWVHESQIKDAEAKGAFPVDKSLIPDKV